MHGIRLNWLEITRYRNIAAGTKLSFGRKLNMVLGRNGAGKSALLRLLAAILTGDFEPLAEEPLQIAYCLTAAPLRLKVNIKNDPSGDPAWSVELELADNVQVVCTASFVEKKGTLHVHGRADSHPLSISSPFQGDSLYEVLNEIRDVLEFEIDDEEDDLDDDDLDEEDEDDLDDDLDDDDLDEEEDPDHEDGGDEHKERDEDKDHRYTGLMATLRLSWEKLEAASENTCRFGEGLAVFDAIRGEILEDLGDPDWAYMIVRMKDRKVDVRYASFVPDELRRVIQEKKPEDFDADELHVSSDEAPFLRKAAEALGVDEVTLTLPFKREDKGEGQVDLTCHELKLRVVRGGGAPIPSEKLSYGEKRLFSFFYYSAAHPYVVLVDDLLNGLTHDGAEAAIDEIGERQAFVTSRDPLLFAFVPRPDDEEPTLIACTARNREAEREIAWEALDSEAAAPILEACGAGIQEVGKVLRSRSLW
jgi:energy-coupling factor transporter ATP-binding protein EcfA2